MAASKQDCLSAYGFNSSRSGRTYVSILSPSEKVVVAIVFQRLLKAIRVHAGN